MPMLPHRFTEQYNIPSCSVACVKMLRRLSRQETDISWLGCPVFLIDECPFEGWAQVCSDGEKKNGWMSHIGKCMCGVHRENGTGLNACAYSEGIWWHHRARGVTEWLDQFGYMWIMLWPTQSPNLNPVKHLLCCLRYSVATAAAQLAELFLKMTSWVVVISSGCLLGLFYVISQTEWKP